jgi:hypothetical protein
MLGAIHTEVTNNLVMVIRSMIRSESSVGKIATTL